jgi:hypothetical protein
MIKHVENTVKDYPGEIEVSKSPWNNKLSIIEPSCKKLTQQNIEIFHTFLAKGLFLCKKGWREIQPAIAYLCTQVQDPDNQDWNKLVKLLGFWKYKKDDVLSLDGDNISEIKWFVNASFTVHNDKKSHTGVTMSLGRGAVPSISTKQKICTRSSMEAELVSVDDVALKALWTKRFLEHQGVQITLNVIFCYNMSSMKMVQTVKLVLVNELDISKLNIFILLSLLKEEKLPLNTIQLRKC